ncbi:pyrroline-5-carboxylate reductase [Deltaproteobacteria bacterium Smac51]|nr:pyrroline-5-carboxylate reductase [Deltaproteobacteria bacterium Smac51]
MSIEIGFLGYGKMAGAISDGLNKKLIPYSRQIAADHYKAQVDKAAEAKGIIAAADNLEAARSSRVLVLAVKPQQALGVLHEISGVLTEEHLIISLAAGVRLKSLRSALPEYVGLIRTMPNVAALAGCGTMLLCREAKADPANMAKALGICESVGLCLELDESLFDAGTAVSGSGPAYFYMIMEALTRGAVRLGIPYDTAKAMVVQTALGAAETARIDGAPPLSELRDMVTSPGGTTAAALHVLEVGGLNGVLQEALEAATEKSLELSSRQ